MIPFGPQNRRPMFVTNQVKLVGSAKLINGKHLKIQVKERDKDAPLDAIAFGFGNLRESLSLTKSFRIAYHIDLNEFRGRKRLQLIVRDIKFYN